MFETNTDSSPCLAAGSAVAYPKSKLMFLNKCLLNKKGKTRWEYCSLHPCCNSLNACFNNVPPPGFLDTLIRLFSFDVSCCCLYSAAGAHAKRQELLQHFLKEVQSHTGSLWDAPNVVAEICHWNLHPEEQRFAARISGACQWRTSFTPLPPHPIQCRSCVHTPVTPTSTLRVGSVY